MMNSQIIILFGILSAWSCDEDRIQVGVPEFFCKNGQMLNKQADITTVKLLENEIDEIKYKFNVKFRSTDNKCQNNQRCTLMMWRDVRAFNAFLNQFSTNGVLEINNTLIKPGIEYIIEVLASKHDQIIEKKQLFIDYVSNEFVKTMVKPEASINLLGSNFGYTFSPFYVYADVHLCKNISYYLKWTLLSDEGENTTVLPYKGGELFISSNSFHSSQNYDLKAEVIDSNNGNPVASTQQRVMILAKSIELYMPIKVWTTRINQPINVKTYLKYAEDAKNIKMKWLCVEITSNETCIYQGETKETETDTFFTKPGKYNITLQVFQGNKTLVDSCTIHVAEKAPIVDIDEVDNPTNPLSGLEIRTTIYEIQTFCSLQWTSVQSNDYEWLNLSRIPGNPSELINVTTKEDVFLNELEEFSNDSVDLSHNLAIPPPNEMWEGLKGDSKYLFRLIIICPDSEKTEEMHNDVLIKTKSPPVIQSLQVTPPEGIALITMFKFKTQTAQNKENERPILFKFGYYLEEKNIVLRNLLEISETELSLPYSELGVQTFVECCDNFSNCRRLNGPLVKLHPPEATDKETILKKFTQKMLLEDYNDAFTAAIGILNTYKKNIEVNVFVLENIDKEIDKFLNIDNGHFNDRWINNANNLMTSISNYNNQLQLPESSLNKLIDLRNKVSGMSQRFTKRNIPSTRRRRSIINLNDTRNYIALSELMIMRSTDPHRINIEKENLRLQIKNYMEQLCTNLKKNEIKQALSTLLLSVEKLTKNSLNRFISVPYENNPWNNTARIKFGNIVLLKDTKQKCIGKAIFRGYLDKPGLLYYTDVINSRNNLDLGEIIVYLPRNLSIEGKPNCLVYRDGWQSSCKFVQNLPSFVQCSCKHLGYFYLEYSKIAVTEKTTKKVIAETTPANVESDDTGNETFARIYGENISPDNYDTISYVVIIVSVIGIVVVTVILRKIFHDDDDDDKEDSETFDFPKYAQLHNEEYLNDAHI